MSNGSKRTVVLTGASTGIGQATALMLAEKGFHVLAGVRKEADGDQLKELSNGAVTPIQLDVLVQADRDNLVKLINEEYEGELYGLVNNAGVVSLNIVELAEMEVMRNEMEVNYFGPLALIKALLPAIRKSKGRIVNVSSANGVISMPTVGSYAASKFALEALSDALRMELESCGVKVVVIQPGQIKTVIFDKAESVYTKMMEGVSKEDMEIYGTLLKGAGNAIQGGKNSPTAPERVAEAIHTALDAETVATRYLVGEDAQGLVQTRKESSDEEMDKAVLGFFGL